MPQFSNLTDQNIKYTDILTYVTIRSFRNVKDKKCFPAYETIANRANVSRGFVIESIKRLEEARFIYVIRSTTKHISNEYIFPDLKSFEMVPYELFDFPISANDKAMLLYLRQLCNSGLLQSQFKIKDLAREFGVTYKVIHKQYHSLIDNGFIKDFKTSSSSQWKRFAFTDKMDWEYDYGKSLKFLRVSATDKLEIKDLHVPIIQLPKLQDTFIGTLKTA